MTDPTARDIGTAEPEPPPHVLELRVHGVNNTTPAALLDLPPEGVRTVTGDKLGSFWEPTAEALAAADGGRGHVPPGIRREAYSWGGMVRTTPEVGGTGAVGKVLAAAARVFYAILLPFSIGNAVQWSRRLEGDAAGVWASCTAGATRLFGLVLTLLFTSTAASIALDIGAAQCGAQPALCGPLEGLLAPVEAWSPGLRLAFFSLLPVLAVTVLWIVSAVSQVRYDVLPGMKGGTAAHATESPASAVLSQPGFWSNRLTRHLARTHLAAAISLTTMFIGLQASLGWGTRCRGLVLMGCWDAGAVGWRFWLGIAVAAIGLLGVVAAAVLVCTLPTMRIQTEDEVEGAAPNRASQWLLLLSAVVFGGVVLALALVPTADVGPMRQYGAGMAPLLLVAAGTVLVVLGFWFRPASARGSAVAWAGRAPAVFMTMSLAVSAAVSSLVAVSVGDVLNGSRGPTELIRQDEAVAPSGGRVSVVWTDARTGETGVVEVGGPLEVLPSIEISRSYVAIGTLVLVALVLALIWILIRVFAGRRSLIARADAWRSAPTAVPQPDGGEMPPSTPEHIIVPEGGVLPPSAKNLFGRISDKRRSAARLHLMEPAVGALAIWLFAALVCGIGWTVWAFATGGELWGDLTGFWRDVVISLIDVGMVVLAWVGVLLVGLLAAGAAGGGTRPLGIVWDIACYLPRTGHPFGPPCYAERAVPEIAGRLNRWLRQDDSRRAILAAHSMGAVLAVSALGLLASSPSTRPALSRIALLTFGVQLRPFFGRMLPELLGPDVLGAHPSLPPRFGDADPWRADFDAQQASTARHPTAAPDGDGPPVGWVAGTLLPRLVDDPASPAVRVRWISLWRLTDYLGFPAVSTAPRGVDWDNIVDRYASELDASGYMVEVGTHGEYYRVAEYDESVMQLRDRLIADPD
ncbi:hypothetical protein GCM10022200_13850 [Microbacterium awajiense]|uniref:Integral membrane protein n=1 Tax=Microbacterium awajiense TaxID=415214 RepID=A0ABP7AGM6_9MICO